MHSRILVVVRLLLLVSLGLSTPIRASSVPQISGRRIPFEMTNNLVFLPVTINGSRPLVFILDTGASTTVIDERKAKALSLKLEGRKDATTQGGSIEASFVRNVDMAVAGVNLPKMTLAAIRLSGLEAGLGRAVDGVLGYEVFQRFVVEIDYSARVVIFHEPHSYTYAGSGEIIPLTIEDNTPFVAAKIGGPRPAEGSFLVDTGAPAMLNVAGPFARSHRLPDVDAPALSITSGALLAGKSRSLVARVPSFRLGKFVLTSPVATFSQDAAGSEGAEASVSYGGLIGAEILRRFRVTADYSRNQMILEPNQHFSEPYEFDMSGMSLAASGEDFATFSIRALVDRSPAAQADFRIGDVIAAIDGRSTSGMTLDEIRRMFRQHGRRFTVTVKRQGTVTPITFTTRRLI